MCQPRVCRVVRGLLKGSQMAETIEKVEPIRESSGAGDDLKTRLIDHFDVIKRPNDLVRITRVTCSHFRVNTLSPTLEADAVLPTYRIVKSQFLHVEDRRGELVITDQTRN